VEALDREGAPLGIDLKHVLEIVETDLIGDRVVGAAEQVGREHLRRAEARRLFIGAGERRGTDEGNHGRERDRCNPTKPDFTLATQLAPLTKAVSLASKHSAEKDARN